MDRTATSLVHRSVMMIDTRGLGTRIRRYLPMCKQGIVYRMTACLLSMCTNEVILFSISLCNLQFTILDNYSVMLCAMESPLSVSTCAK